jgi:hypothetical protein
MVSVSMRDYGARDRIPRIDVKIPGRAVQAVRLALEQIVHQCLKLV